MIRNLKALGLAFAAILVMGVVAASAASAQQGMLTTETGGPVTLIGVEDPEGTNAVTAFGSKLECPNSLYTGHAVNTTPHEPVPNEATQLTITPHFNQADCEADSGHGATVEMNSCDVEITKGQTEGEENTYSGTGGIVCDTEGDEIHVGLYSNQHHESGRVCTLEVPEQTGLSGPHVTDNGDGTLSTAGAISGAEATRHGLCVLDGKGTTTNGGELHLDADITAEAEGGAVGIALSH